MSTAAVAFPFKDSAGVDRTGQTMPLTDGGQIATDTVVKSTATSRSGTIAAGGTAQSFMAANAARRGFTIQNQSSGDLFINGLAAAAPDGSSLKVEAGAIYETGAHHVGTGALSIYGATTGQIFYAREF